MADRAPDPTADTTRGRPADPGDDPRAHGPAPWRPPPIGPDGTPTEPTTVGADLATWARHELGFTAATVLPGSAGPAAAGRRRHRGAIADARRRQRPVLRHVSPDRPDPTLEAVLPGVADAVVVPMVAGGTVVAVFVGAWPHADGLPEPVAEALFAATSTAADHLGRAEPSATTAPPEDRAVRATDGAEPSEAAGAPPDRARAAVYLTLALVAAATPLVALTGPPALRAACGLVTVLAVPGAVVTGFLRRPDALDEVAVALGASIAVAVLGTQVLLWTGAWHPAVLLVLTSSAALVLVRHAVRAATGHPSPAPGGRATGATT